MDETINLEPAFEFRCSKCNTKNFVSGKFIPPEELGLPNILPPGVTSAEFLVPPDKVICNKCRTIFSTDTGCSPFG